MKPHIVLSYTYGFRVIEVYANRNAHWPVCQVRTWESAAKCRIFQKRQINIYNTKQKWKTGYT